LNQTAGIMSKNLNTLIPKAGLIDVPDPVPITPVEFIQQVIANLNVQLGPIDNEIAKAKTGDVSYVRAFYDCLHEIKSRIDQAEMILLEVTSDPQKLELSNARIEGPAETFYRLNQLIEAVKELETEIKETEYDYYRVVAELLEDIHLKMTEFKPYSAIPYVQQVINKVEAIENELKRQILWSFREIGSLTSSERYDPESGPSSSSTSSLSSSDSSSSASASSGPPSSSSSTRSKAANRVVSGAWNLDISSLNQIYLIVDVLGDKFRNDVLERFAQLQLLSYEKLFRYGTKYAGLDCLDQRYAWFKYLLHLVEEKLSTIIPTKWGLTYHLYIEYARRTKRHLHDVLSEIEKETIVLHDQEHVQMILKALKSVVAFEAEIKASFIAKERFEAGLESNDGNFELPISIRDAFDPFLSGYVYMERVGLETLMKDMLREEDQAASSAAAASVGGEKGTSGGSVQPSEPYESSRKMFEYIKGSLKRCTVFSTGLTYLSLSKEFRICLHQYSESLKFRCPSPTVASRHGKPPIYSITKTIETTLCRILCTAEYCIDTIPSLENMMKTRIQEEYKPEVDFQQQIDIFNDLMSYTMIILVNGEIHRMDIDFATMKKIDWSRVDNVTDVGPYIKHMLKILSDCIPRLRLWISSAYFLTLCMNMANFYLDCFLDNIWSLKRISKTGAGQLLLDLNGIKEYLEKMPNTRLSEGKTEIMIGKAYTIAMNKKIKHIENILKLLCTEDNMMDEMFTVLWPEATKEEMDQILILKGSKMAMPNLSIPPIQMDPNLKKGVTHMKEGTNKAYEDMKGKFKNFTTDLGNLMGSGGLFESSTHSHTSEHNEASTNGNHKMASSGPGSSSSSGHGSLGFKTLGGIVSQFGTSPHSATSSQPGSGASPRNNKRASTSNINIFSPPPPGPKTNK
jgi:hypothetical protein